GDAVDPARRVVGHPADAPGFQGVQEGGLDHVLDEVEVPPAEDAGQHGHQAARLMAEEVLHERGDRLRLGRGHGRVFRRDVNRFLLIHFPIVRPCRERTSTEPPRRKIGQPLASWAAASRVSAWTMEKPPTISFTSMNGPSETTFLALTTRP